MKEQKTSHLLSTFEQSSFQSTQERKILSQLATFDIQPPKSRNLLTSHLKAAYSDVHTEVSA